MRASEGSRGNRVYTQMMGTKEEWGNERLRGGEYVADCMFKIMGVLICLMK